MAVEWDETSPFYKALVSTTHSLSQVSLHSAWEGHYDNSRHLYRITIIFSSPSHPLPYFTYYVALMYCHTLSGNASESGARCTRFLIFGYFLSPLSEIASANVHEPRHDWIIWNELETRREIEKREMHTFNHSGSWRRDLVTWNWNCEGIWMVSMSCTAHEAREWAVRLSGCPSGKSDLKYFNHRPSVISCGTPGFWSGWIETLGFHVERGVSG